MNFKGVGQGEGWPWGFGIGFDYLTNSVRLGIFELFVGAVEAAFEAEVVPGVELGQFDGGGVAEGVFAVGEVVEFVFQIEGTEHVPAGGDEFVEEDVFEGAFGLDLGVEFVSQIVENRLEIGRDGLGGEAVFAGVLGGDALAFGGGGSGRHEGLVLSVGCTPA